MLSLWIFPNGADSIDALFEIDSCFKALRLPTHRFGGQSLQFGITKMQIIVFENKLYKAIVEESFCLFLVSFFDNIISQYEESPLPSVNQVKDRGLKALGWWIVFSSAFTLQNN